MLDDRLEERLDQRRCERLPTGVECDLPPVPLITEAGAPNTRNVASFCAITGEIVNIADAYTAEGYDFSGTRAFDAKTGYRTKQMLVAPVLEAGT